MNIKKAAIILLILILIAYTIYLMFRRVYREGTPFMPSKIKQWAAEGPREPSDKIISGEEAGPPARTQAILSVPSQETGIKDVGDRSR